MTTTLINESMKRATLKVAIISQENRLLSDKNWMTLNNLINGNFKIYGKPKVELMFSDSTNVLEAVDSAKMSNIGYSLNPKQFDLDEIINLHNQSLPVR